MASAPAQVSTMFLRPCPSLISKGTSRRSQPQGSLIRFRWCVLSIASQRQGVCRTKRPIRVQTRIGINLRAVAGLELFSCHLQRRLHVNVLMARYSPTAFTFLLSLRKWPVHTSPSTAATPRPVSSGLGELDGFSRVSGFPGVKGPGQSVRCS